MHRSNAFKSSRFIKTAKDIVSRSFDEHRVDVLMPKSLTAETPVLIVHDGMNVLFERYASNGHTWQIREAIASGKLLADPLVIAVWGEGGTKKYNSRRINEFLCDDIFAKRTELWNTLNPLLKPETTEARGNYFLDLVANQILPETLNHFGVNHDAKRTAIAGCSVAGVASIYSLAKRPDIFGAALSFSSHWEFGGKALIEDLAAMLPTPGHHLIWSDTGTEELDTPSMSLNPYFGELVRARGFNEHQDFEAPTFWGTGHNEIYWSRRFDYAVNFWLKSLGGEKL